MRPRCRIACVADLCCGCCRLPLLPPAAMKGLLLAWLSPQADGGLVCRRCGLEYLRQRVLPGESLLPPGQEPGNRLPREDYLPVSFASCHGCGAPGYDADWPLVAGQAQRTWKHLDGYAG